MSKKATKLFEKHGAEFLRMALDVNFYGKRLRSAKLEAAENILAEFDTSVSDFIEAGALVDWLNENKPAKPEKAKAERSAKASAKPAADTIVEGLESIPDLPILATMFDAVIITSAQNNTAPFMPAWAALLQFAADNNAQVVVLPVWYNKNAFSAAKESEQERFDAAFLPYMVMQDTAIFTPDSVVLRPSAAVVATAKLPVNAAATLNSGELVTVVPSPKQQLKTLPRSPATAIKEAWTTGTMTGQNYTRSRAGAEAGADHVFGAVLIEQTPDGVLYPRNLVFKDGVICDYSQAPENSVLVLGDLHCEMKDDDIWSDTLDLCERVRPRLIAVHDILHFSTANHHNRNNGKHLYAVKDKQVIDDLLTVIQDLNQLAEIAPVYVVESNHNSALDNWLHDIGYNPKRDPRQAKIYYLLNYLVAESMDNGENKNALQVAFEQLDQFDIFPELSDAVTFGSMDKAHLIHGCDLSQHGHKGQNGSAGSTGLFSRWGQSMITGHTHSPAIVGNVLTVGVTASLHQGYNAGGASSWNQSHGIVFPNGAKQIVPVRGLYR